MPLQEDSNVDIFRDWRSPGHRLREARDKKLTLMVNKYYHQKQQDYKHMAATAKTTYPIDI